MVLCILNSGCKLSSRYRNPHLPVHPVMFSFYDLPLVIFLQLFQVLCWHRIQPIPPPPVLTLVAYRAFQEIF